MVKCSAAKNNLLHVFAPSLFFFDFVYKLKPNEPVGIGVDFAENIVSAAFYNQNKFIT